MWRRERHIRGISDAPNGPLWTLNVLNGPFATSAMSPTRLSQQRPALRARAGALSPWPSAHAPQPVSRLSGVGFLFWFPRLRLLAVPLLEHGPDPQWRAPAGCGAREG